MTILNVVLYIGLPFLLAGFIVYWYGWRMIKKQKAEKVEAEKISLETAFVKSETVSVMAEQPIEARIYDAAKRAIYNDTLPGNVVARIRADYRTIGRQWNKDGKWLYAFNLIPDGNYIPVELSLDATRENPPTRVHRALNQKEKVGIFFNVKLQKSFMQQYGKYMPYFLGIAFIIFMMVANGTK